VQTTYRLQNLRNLINSVLDDISNRRTQKLNQYDLDLNDRFTRKCLKGKNSYPAQGKKCRVNILTLG